MKKKKMKYYVVFKGLVPGVYDTWDEVLEQTSGVSGAAYKSYNTPEEAAEAYRKFSGVEDRQELYRLLSAATPAEAPAVNLETIHNNPEIDSDAWAVDASCLRNPGRMEYRGINLKTGEEIFRVGPFEDATNNVGEFLALVHAMALMAKEGEYHNIYSDSQIALNWVKRRKHNSKLTATPNNAKVFELLARANQWVQTHNFPGVLRKWETERWGEIPADFGRK